MLQVSYCVSLWRTSQHHIVELEVAVDLAFHRVSSSSYSMFLAILYCTCQQHVVELEVAVDDGGARGVQVCQPRRDLDGPPHAVLIRVDHLGAKRCRSGLRNGLLAFPLGAQARCPRAAGGGGGGGKQLLPPIREALDLGLSMQVVHAACHSAKLNQAFQFLGPGSACHSRRLAAAQRTLCHLGGDGVKQLAGRGDG